VKQAKHINDSKNSELHTQRETKGMQRFTPRYDMREWKYKTCKRFKSSFNEYRFLNEFKKKKKEMKKTPFFNLS
jgi:hypothetical protein